MGTDADNAVCLRTTNKPPPDVNKHNVKLSSSSSYHHNIINIKRKSICKNSKLKNLVFRFFDTILGLQKTICKEPLLSTDILHGICKFERGRLVSWSGAQYIIMGYRYFNQSWEIYIKFCLFLAFFIRPLIFCKQDSSPW